MSGAWQQDGVLMEPEMITRDPGVTDISTTPVFENGRIVFKCTVVDYDLAGNELSRKTTNSGSVGFDDRPMTKDEALEIMGRGVL